MSAILIRWNMMVFWFQVGKIWVEYGPFYYMVEVSTVLQTVTPNSSCFLLQKYSIRYFLINLKMGLKMDLCEIWLRSEHILKVCQCSSITKSNSSSFILYDYWSGGRPAGYSMNIMPRVAQADQMRWRSDDQRRSAGPECGSYLVLKCIIHMTGASTNPKKLTLKKLWIVWLIVCRLKISLKLFFRQWIFFFKSWT